MNYSFEDYEKLVLEWAKARQIIPNATSTSQLLKAVSEMGELADAINEGNGHEMVDAIGDIVVCLINLCALNAIDITSCLACAYHQIKDRKGTLLPNGLFVKKETEETHD